MWVISKTMFLGVLFSGILRKGDSLRGIPFGKILQQTHRCYKTRSELLSMKHGLEGRNSIPFYKPKSENQRKYMEVLNNKDVPLVFVLGPAGTGKTLFACMKAIQDLKSGIIQKIVITRPVVAVEDENIGFLPGDIQHKMDPWTRPIFDIFLEYYNQRELDEMIQGNVIEIAPLAFMRGRTFKKCFILADEMQNSSPNQMLMLTTRIGEGSRMVVTGDLSQSDLLGGNRKENNGLYDFIEKYRNYRRVVGGGGETDGISVCELQIGDIERSPIVAKVLEIFRVGERTLGAEQDTDAAIIPKKDYFSKNKPLW